MLSIMGEVVPPITTWKTPDSRSGSVWGSARTARPGPRPYGSRKRAALHVHRRLFRKRKSLPNVLHLAWRGGRGCPVGRDPRGGNCYYLFSRMEIS